MVLTRVEASEDDDPVLGQFLGFLARDIANHSERLRGVDSGLVQRLKTLVGGIEVDLRAKLFQQYRLFFRYHAPSKLIVFAWVNNEDTKRTYESSDDAYRVFRKILESGHPPDDWNQLLAEARAEGQRLQQFAAALTPKDLAFMADGVVMGQRA